MSSVEARWYLLHLLPGTWLHGHGGAGWRAGQAGLQAGSTLQGSKVCSSRLLLVRPYPVSHSSAGCRECCAWDSSAKAAAAIAGSPHCQAAANEPCASQGCRERGELWAATGLGWNTRSWWLVKASCANSARNTCPKASPL